ncbi:MAG: glycosyltransferase family 2 protein [Candidatus Delongbacteria bacterium]|nr:glycosyltransferase family 2 protein [Candidatus Delongbacteria bacterium]
MTDNSSKIKPLISILMPVRNSEQFLTMTINSILDQTENNWELIVVNDHSEDSSQQILEDFSNKDRRITVLQNEEGDGIITALKTAFIHSRGDLITRMDSDDLMTEYKLEKMKKLYLASGKGHVITGPVKCFSDTEIGDGYKKYEKWLNHLILNEDCYNEIYRECVIQSSCWLVHRDDLIRCKAFNTNIYPEDYDLAFRFYKYGLKVRSYNELLHYWRDHPARISRNDPRYKDQQFFDLKLKYFFELDHNREKTLVVWGTGSKGKKLVKILHDKFDIPFRWVSNNLKKIGETIYGTCIEDYRTIKNIDKLQIIVTVSGPDDLKNIAVFFDENNFLQNKHYFYFC